MVYRPMGYHNQELARYLDGKIQVCGVSVPATPCWVVKVGDEGPVYVSIALIVWHKVGGRGHEQIVAAGYIPARQEVGSYRAFHQWSTPFYTVSKKGICTESPYLLGYAEVEIDHDYWNARYTEWQKRKAKRREGSLKSWRTRKLRLLSEAGIFVMSET